MAKRGENTYKRKDGRWEARIIRGYDENGKALYAYFYGRSYKEVKDPVFQPLLYMGNIPDSTASVTNNTPLFRDVLDSWLDNSKIKLKVSSYVKYYNIINNHVKPALGDYLLMDITSTVLNSYIVEKPKTRKCDVSGGLSVKTARDIVTVIKSALQSAKDELLLSDAEINLVDCKMKMNT